VSNILGHDAPIAAFLSAMRGDKMHHAWLLTGAEGIGKARTASLLAKRMLCEAAGPPIAGSGAETPESHPIGKLVDAWSHPDFKLLERQPKDMKLVKELDRRDWPVGIELVRNINVDQVRGLNSLFATKPSFSARRAVIVDAIDDMERGAANALLKNLEEPPHGTIFLLISHAPGRLLPTIRSRCRTLRFAPLGEAEMRQAIRREMPALDEAELAALVKAGEGSPGRALSFAGLDIGGIDAALAQLATTGDASNEVRSELAQKLSTKAAQRRFEAFLARCPTFIASEAQRRSGDALAPAIAAWEQARALAESAVRQSLDPQMTVFALAGHVAGLAPKA
jgi:DNA polymerase III subunit delta'